VPSRVKELMAQELVDRYRPVGGMVAIGYGGIPAEEATTLRRDLRAKRVDLRVVKCSIARIAFEQLGRKEFGEFLQGQVAVLSSADPVAASKAATELARTKKFPVKGGWAEGRTLSPEEVKRLAEIPPREALLAQMARLIAAPVTRLAAALGAPAASLARAIKAWNEKRGSATPAPDAGAAAGPAASTDTGGSQSAAGEGAPAAKAQ